MTTLFVGNLPFQATDEDIAFAFQSFGCTSAEMQKHDDSGRSKGWALVTVTADAASAIAGTLDSDFQGRKLLVREDRGPTPKEDRPPRPRKEKKERAPREEGAEGADRPPRQRKPKAERKPREDYGEPVPSNTIFVGNLPWAVDAETLVPLFPGHLTAEVQTRKDGRSNGYALVSFENIEQAQHAIDFSNGMDISGRPCLCRFDRG